MKKNEASHQVGHFTIGRRIHSTSEKSVYFASNPNGTRNLSDAAVYQLHPNHRLEQNSIDLTADAEILRQLNHSSFPKILHSYELEHAFAREWIDGVTFRELISIHNRSKIPIELPTIFDIIYRLIDSLLHLHQNGIIHGRINWDHIFLQFDGQIRVIGLSVKNRDNIPSFSSPEQATNTFLDWRSDQWSLGGIFVCLLLKEPLYTGRPNAGYASKTGDVKHWLERIRVTYPNAHKIVSKMLEPAAGERFQNLSNLQKSIHQLTIEYPSSSRVQLAEALQSWVPPRTVPLPVSMPKHSNAKVLPIPEPKMTNKFPDITELLEPEIESFIEVTQHNTPLLTNETYTEQEAEPLFFTEDVTETDSPPPVINVQSKPISAPPPHKQIENTEVSLDTVAIVTAAADGKSNDVQFVALVLIILNAIVLCVMIFRYL